MKTSPENSDSTGLDDYLETSSQQTNSEYLDNRKPRVQALRLRRKIEELEDARRLKELLSYDDWDD